ncbi:MAG: formylglycine-generating enzyme family protein [Planctomycetota bacterium]|jgi:formylglycine-generating enzyme required for sulfatase activity|nr:formylglycine-generating enzyme family protein [Planctomycetota bacterium]
MKLWICGLFLVTVLVSCGSTEVFDGPGHREVFLAARQVMDGYRPDHIVAVDENVLDWETVDTSLPNSIIYYLSIGCLGKTVDSLQVELDPSTHRKTRVRVRASAEGVVGFLPWLWPRRSVEKHVLAQIRNELAHRARNRAEGLEDEQLTGLGVKASMGTLGSGTEERQRNGLIRLTDEQVEAFTGVRFELPKPPKISEASKTSEASQVPETSSRTRGGAPMEKKVALDLRSRKVARVTESLPDSHARFSESKSSRSKEVPKFSPSKLSDRDFPKVLPGMVRVPGGYFQMGSTDGEMDERPARQIWVSTFDIDRHEVTNSDYRKFLEFIRVKEDHSFCHPSEPKNKDHTPHSWRHQRYRAFSRAEKPVVGVDWFDAFAYAAWKGKRLATEAEWEKAARGADGNLYPWGNSFESHRLNSLSLGLRSTSRVGQFPLGQSSFGCLDMAGNVSEWCLDAYAEDAYRHMSARDPLEERTLPGRVLRGSSWKDADERVRLSYRNYGLPGRWSLYIGFRCVQDLGAKNSD